MAYQQGKRRGVRRPREHNGYIEEWCPVRCRYVYQHRLVIERELGRFLEPSEVVHHRNGDGLDNRRENLVHHRTHSEHMAEHAATGSWGWPRGKPKPWLRKPTVACPVCGTMFTPRRRSTPNGQQDTTTCSASCGQRHRHAVRA